MTYPTFNTLVPPHFHSDGHYIIVWDIGQLELDAVDEDLVVVGGRFGQDNVDRPWTRNNEESALYELSALPFWSIALLTSFGWSFMTHNDLTSTASRMKSCPLPLAPLTVGSQ